jgi:ribulose-phosphate 3-epimerase
MVKRIKIVPTLLTHSLVEFKTNLKKIEKHFSLVQIDIMDNKFVRNKTYYNLNKIRKIRTKVNYELHLMAKEPLKIIKKWQSFKKVKKIIFHYEAVRKDNDILNIIEYLKSKKIKAGLAINPETKIEKIEKFIPKLDLVFIMGVSPGWGGQILKKSALTKAKKIRKKYSNLDIEIDGGVKMQNIKQVIKSGVNIISVGSLIFNSEDIKQTIKEIKKIV